MVSGYVLILAMLVLGGIIATVGDRIGTKVGKARLSLFNLRPRQTATLVSIATGSVISASTLAILFGISSQLRTGVFELGRIQADLANAEDQLAQALAEQEGVREDLEAASTERQRALTRLRDINQSLAQAVKQQRITQQQLQRTQTQLQGTRDQLATVSEQAVALRQSTDSLRAERDRLVQQQEAIRAQIAERDQAIEDLDQSIAERDQAIAERERRLANLQTRQNLLSQQVRDLENQYQGLFQGSIVLGRNQELLSGVFTINNRSEAQAVVNQLLAEANRRTIQAIAPGTSLDQRAIAIGDQEVERLIDRLAVGGDFVIRVLSAANYVIGEPCVVRGEAPCIRVFVDAGPNALIYPQGTLLSSVALETPTRTDQELVERMNVLLAATQFIASQNGVIDDTMIIADNRTETLLRFLTAVQQETQPLDLQTVTLTDLYAAGPIQIDVVASRNGRTLFRSRDFIRPGASPGP
ncbi:MAG: hypothetical protein RLZZ597_3646 [Cyanobacteriota bacterium]|jgi:uncharacterized protein (DUF3084 family)